VPKAVYASDAVRDHNREVVEEYLGDVEMTPDEGHDDRTTAQRHYVRRFVRLQDVVERLLVRLRITDGMDSERNTGLLLTLRNALEDNPDAEATLFQMSPGASRRRGVTSRGEIVNLFQGEYPVNPPARRGTVYPGDRRIRDSERVTVQIHRLVLTQDGCDIAEDVRVVAVWVPQHLALPWLSQAQPRREG